MYDNKIQIEDKEGNIVVLTAEEILYQIDPSEIEAYAENNLNMIDLDNASEFDLVELLEQWGYDFMENISDQDCLDYLESEGYTMVKEGESEDYDYVDQSLFEDISNVFYNLNVFDRQKLRDLVVNFK